MQDFYCPDGRAEVWLYRKNYFKGLIASEIAIENTTSGTGSPVSLAFLNEGECFRFTVKPGTYRLHMTGVHGINPVCLGL